MMKTRALSGAELATLEAAGCQAEDWANVAVTDGFDPARVARVTFRGRVTIGDLQGTVSLEGVDLPAGLSDATIIDCDLGNDVLIQRVHGYLANYRVGNGAAIVDVGEMVTRPGATFGNGAELETVNEAGGREVRMIAELSSTFAYLLCLHRYREGMIAGLERMIDGYVEDMTSDVGVVGEKAVVAHVGEIVDVKVGPYARVSSCPSLKNGTILSEEAAVTRVGAGVAAEDFIIGEGSTVDSGAILSKCFVGQGVRMGKQFSGENTLVFANSECFHSEACAIFAGPYSVTHHKSTLLIASVYSFCNAGSGTNHSNHMYKLGPVHQGILERGSKTGSFGYLLLPSVVGAFSVVIGKHFTNFDTSDLPFSYITEDHGQSMLTPGMNLWTVGTIRDGEKWPSRDRRTATTRRDLLRFEVLSPYTVGKMVRGERKLKDLYEKTPKSVESVRIAGLRVKRLVLRVGIRAYGNAVDLYLKEKISARAGALSDGIDEVRERLSASEGVYSERWADIGGLLVAGERLDSLAGDVASGKIDSVRAFQEAFQGAHDAYEGDEWAWVRQTYESRTGQSVDSLTVEDLEGIADDFRKLMATALKKVIADAEKEFDDVAKIGYGADGDDEAADTDFELVRGSFDGNSFVRQMRERLEELET